ncbi:MBL fold metallo-hydrolase [Kribbella pittospori]|uniref:MBL fold metallo-hydrolase n=1 Tax=Kribbella pittospori TaxID=722689 RepID=A0A4R0K8Z5_9ACTN|nr:MBL fold metallo-hydrolase [Kribbella pittospori]TCC55980.1 MBL fold metallo-hydrolase [Kribbella pittospori]
MDVTVVGSGDAFGAGGRFQTCIAVGTRILVDCGATSLTALRQQDFDPNEIRTVVVTHLHGDHFGGLPFLILDGQFRRRTEDLTVFGPPGTSERLATAMETLYPGSSQVQRRFQVHVVDHVDRHPQEVDDVRITPFEVRHASGAPAYAVQLQTSGGSLAYSGDTEWTDALFDAADGVDLFLCEGYSPAPIRWHLDLEALTRHRDSFTCRKLVLTHLSQSALTADLSAWQVAYDGLRVLL